jgi:small nuclear ribonucleoprotein (snRNP)-like protein
MGKIIIVELKNDLALRGTLHSVDQYLNIKLTGMTVVDPKKYPHLVTILSFGPNVLVGLHNLPF